MKFKLLKPTIEMKKEYLDFIEEFNERNEQIIPYSARLLDMDYKTWLNYTYKIESKDTCPQEFVPANTYLLVDESMRILGAINIRHYLNEYLLNYGGHIGYGIRPSERKKGYGKLMLSLGLPIAKKLGINKVLITCAKENIGSAKTIISNGGILENEVLEKDKLIQRYWIENK